MSNWLQKPDVMSVLQDITRRLQVLETGNPVASGSITDGLLALKSGGKIQLNNAGEIELVNNGKITLTDSQGNLRVEITQDNITIYEPNGDIRWTSDVAWNSTIHPVQAGVTNISGTTWTTIANYNRRGPAAKYVEAGCLVNPDFGASGDLRLYNVSDAFPSVLVTTTGLTQNVSATYYIVRLESELDLPSGTDYNSIELQARTTTGSMSVRPVDAGFTV